MRVLIVGAGAVGFHLASRLVEESQEVVLVDSDPERVRHATENLDVLALQGNGASLPVLEEAGIRRANLLLAVSGSDEVNLLACLAAARAGVRVKVARLRRPDELRPGALLGRGDFGVDLLISPEQECALEIFQLLATEAATDLARFGEGRVHLLGLRIRPGAPVAGKTVRALDQEFQGHRFTLVAVVRGDETTIPTGGTVVEEGDKVFVMAPADQVSALAPLAGHDPGPLHRVMIAGGSGEAEVLAGHLQAHGVACTLLERDAIRARELAERLPRALVLNADPTDMELLRMEGVEGIDGFVALTDRDEVNLLVALLAKGAGARRVIPLVHRTEYTELVDQVGLDAVVSPRISAANAILRFLRRGAVASVATVKGSEGEALEAHIESGSRLAGRRVREAKLPQGAILGALIRQGRVIMPRGRDLMEEGDRAVFFVLPGARSALGRLLD
jgi:trk system potassium uptake protein